MRLNVESLKDLYWGPLPFLIYVNDIHSAILKVNIKLFADDTNIFIHNFIRNY